MGNTDPCGIFLILHCGASRDEAVEQNSNCDLSSKAGRVSLGLSFERVVNTDD